jgi:DNA-binding PadR family transcriptional regulator
VRGEGEKKGVNHFEPSRTRHVKRAERITSMQADWPAENIVLALLCEKPMHGYEVAQLVKSDAALRAIWRIELSEVYFLLRKLLKQGYILAQAETRGAGPRRVVYAPTPAGQAALEQWLTTPEPYPRNLRTALLARIYLALRRDPALAVRLVDAQKEHLVGWLERERERPHEDEIVALVHRFRAAQVEAALAALDELRRVALARAATPAT